MSVANTFKKRRIEVTITLQPVEDAVTKVVTRPVFAENGKNEMTLSGLRTSVTVVKAGGFAQGELNLRLFGLSLSLMNQLSTLGRLPMAGRNNTISVRAGDEGGVLSVVYSGTITHAWADFRGAPDVAFHILALAGMSAALTAAPPSSYPGAADVAVIIESIAKRAGYRFENHGVSVQLSNPYYPGSLLDQMKSCAEDAGIDFAVDDGAVIITPRGAPRGIQVPLVSAETGMIGYPEFTRSGIALSCIYNPNVRLLGLIDVKSILTPACGRWRIYSMAHQLDSEAPNGHWITSFSAADPSFAPIS